MGSGRPLTRENETTFREPLREEGKRGLAYFVFQKTLSFELRECRQIAQNLSDEDFRWQKYEKARPDDYVPSESERRQYGLNGNLYIEDRRELGLISEEGIARYKGPFYLDMHTRTQVSDRGQIWFHEESEHNDRPGVYVSVYLSEDRMLWLYEQMRLRPDAEVHIGLEAKLWQHEVDEAVAEHDMRQDYYFERSERAEVLGCTLMVRDAKTPPWHARKHAELTWADPTEEDAPPTKADAVKVAGGPQERLLTRLVRGVGWVIGLLSALLLVLLLK